MEYQCIIIHLYVTVRFLHLLAVITQWSTYRQGKKLNEEGVEVDWGV